MECKIECLQPQYSGVEILKQRTIKLYFSEVLKWTM